MPFREIQQFCAGLKAATKGTPARSRSSPSSTRHVVGRSFGSVSLVIVLVALVMLIAAGLASGRATEVYHRLVADPPHTIPSDADLQELTGWDADVVPRDWTAIVLHHSATDAGSAASFDAYHRQQKGWQSLGYDFVIGNGTGTPNGMIETGPRWRRQEAGAHANSIEFNRQGIGICLVGNFERQVPTPEQMESTKRLVRFLAQRFHIPAERIMGHCDIREGGGTACPGKCFPTDEIRQALKTTVR
jgi:hypothetical protein